MQASTPASEQPLIVYVPLFEDPVPSAPPSKSDASTQTEQPYESRSRRALRLSCSLLSWVLRTISKVANTAGLRTTLTRVILSKLGVGKVATLAALVGFSVQNADQLAGFASWLATGTDRTG